MEIIGNLVIGGESVRGLGAAARAINPGTGDAIEPAFTGASPDQVERACELAWHAVDAYRNVRLNERADFLEAIASNIMDLGDVLIDRCVAETGLAHGRVEGERARTLNQLYMFAGVVRQGDFLGVRHDPAQPERKPLPRPDLKLRNVPVGPVAVFGASNFPLAFSVAGGDTASALAAGCPVVVKAHSAHPGTSELVGHAIQSAVAACNMPAGTFSLLYGSGQVVGQGLVTDHRIRAVAFTGSRTGGTALMNLAAGREEPIPVYAEMSSINPVFIFPHALRKRGPAIAAGFVASMVLGAGQLCTNPGLIFAVDGIDLERFITEARDGLRSQPAGTMLTRSIHQAFCASTKMLVEHPAVTVIARGAAAEQSHDAQAHLFATSLSAFLRDPSLREEVFGASSLIVRCPDIESIRHAIELLEGQLTASLHFDEADERDVLPFIPVLERKIGRILANGFGTGVEVGHAMVHGGPYPSTSEGRSTSVGSLAIERFLRPVCYQNMPDSLLPEAVQSANPLRLAKRVDGVLQP